MLSTGRKLEIPAPEFFSANLLYECVPAERISVSFKKQCFLFSGKFQSFRKNASYSNLTRTELEIPMAKVIFVRPSYLC